MHSRQSSFDHTNGYASSLNESIDAPGPVDFIRAIFTGSNDDEGSKSLTTTQQLAKHHGVRRRKWMYLSYYFPFLKWITQYQWSWFHGDLIAALTMASFYIPMSLSYAANLGHIPPINGLYAFVFNPLIYAFLGSCPQMVVGPEAPGSLLVGTVVRTCIDQGHSRDDNDALNAQVAGIVTTIAGAVIFVAGLARLGFLDSVLSRPFLRGFISAIGIVIFVDQSMTELGLVRLAEREISHGSTADKLVFLFKNIGKAHGLTAAVSLSAFVIIMVSREIKNRLQPRYPKVAYIPDRFLIVVLSAVFTWRFGWDKRGLEVLGEVKSSGGTAIPFHWPFQFKHVKHIDTALSTAFLIAILGFFESSVAGKSLGDGTSGIQGVNISANRELVALGTANLVGGCFMALPAFGGYGRSKLNASTGGTTPMSSILLSLITLLCIFYLLPWFYYLPKGVLSAMVSVVAYSLVEEAPHDIKFFLKIRGWTELSLMAIIFLATVFYSLSTGIALGMGLSLLSLIKHATKPRIQILGKVPGTENRYENAEYFPESLEFIEGCLIVKIPEPLTFANTGELKNRLRRLEKYGTDKAHPSLPRIRGEESNKNIVFDVHGVTSIDGSGTQVLFEIVETYIKRGVRVIFCRLPKKRSKVYGAFERSGIVDICGGDRYFVGSVEEALKLSEIEDLTQYFDETAREWL
jgi:high affinity sulfate transporter 1